MDSYTNQLVERVTVRIANPSSDGALNSRVEDQVRTLLSLFPGDRFSEERLAFQLSQARRIKDVASTDYEVQFGARNGLEVVVEVTLGDVSAEGRGLAFGGDFPTIYDRNGTYVRFKLDLLGLYYANNNAWYGRPDAMLADNPLVQGTPAGEGWDQWLETYAHYGIYGITPIAPQTYLYGGLSAITAGSAGQELFTDKSRSYTGIEDAYLGVVGGSTDARGNRLAYNLTFGRQRFTLADGFLMANTAANGQERAALQANARWASDFLALAQLRYNDTKFELFYIDPDELPAIDSNTTYLGANVEMKPMDGLTLGAAYVTSPSSNFSYFSPVGGIAGTREGLKVYDARLSYSPNPSGQAGPFFGAEYAVQRNKNFDMDARAGWAEAGYSWPQAKWSPTVSYRLSMFSGDDPATATYERWDPILSGGNGQQWVQGANHFKVVQNSNVLAHRVQASFRPSPKVEIVPQLWAFYADQENNIGGNPALSFLDGEEYGFEANVTAKWFINRNTYVHGHLAYTIPGDAAKSALGGDAKNWLSAMVFFRYAF
ncbi:alginate export family protein [Acidimangrovimonas sediminis]|uniref:Alginate export family protein n=1 Tax=Albidovulum sediminis TaxID=3066345 RepID=A0ABT2NJ59_9RHOB|nr:alginate export family protein [Defluviimonas sediminis]